MAYTPTVWKDRAVQNPRQYKDQNNNTLILTPDPGVISEAGTLLNASSMNNIEQGISSATDSARKAKEDNGRYQSEFGFDGAILTNSALTNNILNLDVPTTITTGISNDGNWSIDTAQGVGQEFNATFTASMGAITSFSAILSHANAGSITVSVYDATTSTALGSKTVPYTSITSSTTVASTITFDSPISIVSGHVIHIRMIATAVNWAAAFRSPSSLANTNAIRTTNAWTATIQEPTYDISLNLGYTNKSLSGTAVKVIAPLDPKKWGNAKWTEAEPANTSVVCDVLSSSNVVLKSNITSLQDLSDIDVTTYPSLKLRFTLTRNAVTDTSPTVKDLSTTWEGGDGMIIPNTIQFAELVQATPAAGTYYTLLDVSSGKGILNRLSVALGSTSVASLAIRVTLDGVVTSITPNTATNRAKALSPKAAIANTALNTDHGSTGIDLLPNLTFYKSIKIEITSGTTAFHASADYALKV